MNDVYTKYSPRHYRSHPEFEANVYAENIDSMLEHFNRWLTS